METYTVHTHARIHIQSGEEGEGEGEEEGEGEGEEEGEEEGEGEGQEEGEGEEVYLPANLRAIGDALTTPAPGVYDVAAVVVVAAAAGATAAGAAGAAAAAGAETGPEPTFPMSSLLATRNATGAPTGALRTTTTRKNK